jgi:hypothetical protein
MSIADDSWCVCGHHIIEHRTGRCAAAGCACTAFITPDRAERRERTMKHEKVEGCSICGCSYRGFGNNAAPINDGRCCDDCNTSRVIPARIAGIQQAVRARGSSGEASLDHIGGELQAMNGTLVGIAKHLKRIGDALERRP